MIPCYFKITTSWTIPYCLPWSFSSSRKRTKARITTQTGGWAPSHIISVSGTEARRVRTHSRLTSISLTWAPTSPPWKHLILAVSLSKNDSLTFSTTRPTLGQRTSHIKTPWRFWKRIRSLWTTKHPLSPSTANSLVNAFWATRSPPTAGDMSTTSVSLTSASSIIFIRKWNEWPRVGCSCLG